MKHFYESRTGIVHSQVAGLLVCSANASAIVLSRLSVRSKPVSCSTSELDMSLHDNAQ